MEIKLTRKQWNNLVPIVVQGRRSEKKLGLPLEIDNGDQKIEISAGEVKITIEDDE